MHKGQVKKTIDIAVPVIIINGRGRRNVISISKTRNTTAKRKNRREKADRAVFFESNPHSKGLSFSRSEYVRIAIIRARIHNNNDVIVAKIII